MNLPLQQRATSLQVSMGNRKILVILTISTFKMKMSCLLLMTKKKVLRDIMRNEPLYSGSLSFCLVVSFFILYSLNLTWINEKEHQVSNFVICFFEFFRFRKFLDVITFGLEKLWTILFSDAILSENKIVQTFL